MSTFQSNSINFTKIYENKMILSKFTYTSQFDGGTICSKFYMHRLFNWFISINKKLLKCLPDEILENIFKYIKGSSKLNSISTYMKINISSNVRFDSNKWSIVCINTNTGSICLSYSLFVYNLLILMQTIHVTKSQYIVDKYYNLSTRVCEK